MRVLGPLELESLKAVSLHVGTGEFNPGPLGEPTLLIPETDIIFPAPPPPHTHTFPGRVSLCSSGWLELFLPQVVLGQCFRSSRSKLRACLVELLTPSLLMKVPNSELLTYES